MENSLVIEDEIKNIIDKNPGQNIKEDIELLKIWISIKNDK